MDLNHLYRKRLYNNSNLKLKLMHHKLVLEAKLKKMICHRLDLQISSQLKKRILLKTSIEKAMTNFNRSVWD